MATTPAPTIPKPATPPAGVPRDVTISAGKVLVLVDTTQTPNLVALYKVCTKAVRVFTAYSINEYADEASAQADIKAKGWKYVPEATPAQIGRAHV